MQAIAGLDDLGDRTAGISAVGHLVHRLVEIRVKGFAHRVDALDMMGFERLRQFPLNSLNPPKQCLQQTLALPLIRRHRRQGARKIVGYGQHGAGKIGDAKFMRFGELALAALADIFRLGHEAIIIVL